jgi:hypothetical protein
LIIAGGAPGFAPATNEDMIPKKLIEDAYTKKDSYGLTEYWPTIIQPRQFSDNETVYKIVPHCQRKTQDFAKKDGRSRITFHLYAGVLRLRQLRKTIW